LELLNKHRRSLKFGTDGIRGRADEFPFTNEALVHLGWAIAQWINKTYGSASTKILIGTDTRESCSRIKQALITGLQACPVTIIDAGVIPTPAVYQLIKTEPGFDIGIVISASHNPYIDNGIKLFQAKTGKLSPEDEQMISEFFAQSLDQNTEILRDQEIIQEIIWQEVIWEEAAYKYIKNITERFSPGFLAGYIVVLDCAHGATYKVAEVIFKQLGASVIAYSVEPDGININKNCGSLHTENIQKAVLAHGADIGFAFDGDGDRVIAINKNGQIKDGDDILALLLELPEYNKLDRIVGTVMTNQGFENALKHKNKLLLRTSVGDKYIASCLDTEMLPLGGENSGHIIIKDYLATGDGIFVALKVLESMIVNKNWLLQTFDKHAQILINLPVKKKKDLAQEPCLDIISAHEQNLRDGRILVRYSGTENVLRVMTEAFDYEQAKACASSLAQKLQEILNAD